MHTYALVGILAHGSANPSVVPRGIAGGIVMHPGASQIAEYERVCCCHFPRPPHAQIRQFGAAWAVLWDLLRWGAGAQPSLQKGAMSRFVPLRQASAFWCRSRRRRSRGVRQEQFQAGRQPGRNYSPICPRLVLSYSRAHVCAGHRRSDPRQYLLSVPPPMPLSLGSSCPRTASWPLTVAGIKWLVNLLTGACTAHHLHRALGSVNRHV
jgi:hypothetical protein